MFAPAVFDDSPSRNSSLTDQIANLSLNSVNRDLATSYGLSINNISWEDTARCKNSCFGPNICDLTLNADGRNMPALRKPNFSDLTTDIPIETFSVTAGNETADGKLTRITLSDYVSSVLKKPDLICLRDSVLLASAQACVLPLSESGEVDFVPQIYSYQGTSNDPAVLLLVASNQGTSAHLLTGNQQKLYFNRGGQATKFLAKRLAQDRRERGVPTAGPMSSEESDRNVIFLIQIPLKQREAMKRSSYAYGSYNPNNCAVSAACGMDLSSCEKGSESDEEMSFGMSEDCVQRQSAPLMHKKKKKGMDHAMLRASDKVEGKFVDIREKRMERDERFPIRVTLQFYSVTDDSNLDINDVKAMSQAIDRVYTKGVQQGSLVCETTTRKTESEPASLRPLNIVHDHRKPMFAGV